MEQISQKQSSTQFPASMNDYHPYYESELNTLLNEPWEISDSPYKLHAAFALSALRELCVDEDSEEDLWGTTIPQKTLDRLVIDLSADFNDAAKTGKPIKVGNRSYSIRKANAYDHDRITKVFAFPLKDGEYTIVPEGVINLSEDCSFPIDYDRMKGQAKANRTYFRKIVKVAEDDANAGWDKLTDMEIVVYCWGLFYNRTKSENLLEFLAEYRDHIYVSEADIRSCFSEKASLRGAPVGIYSFSADKVIHWGECNSQRSYAKDVTAEDAEEYWYGKALLSTFKPIQ